MVKILPPFHVRFFRISNGFQKGTQNYHNFANWIPILEGDTFMSLWLNSLMVYIKHFLLKKCQNFTPFHVRFFRISNGFQKGTQNCASKFHNLSNSIPILTWDTSKNLWLNSLTICIQIIRLIEGPNFDPFSCLIFPYFQWLLKYMSPKLHF